jgi:hypothetical protein
VNTQPEPQPALRHQAWVHARSPFKAISYCKQSIYHRLGIITAEKKFVIGEW